MILQKEVTESLHPLETTILAAFKEKESYSRDELITRAGITPSQLRTAVEWLLVKNLISSRDEGIEEFAALSKKGEELARSGMPEAKILKALSEVKKKKISISDLEKITGLTRETISPAIGFLKKQGAIDIKEGVLQSKSLKKVSAAVSEKEKLLRKIRDAGKLDMKELSPEEQNEVREGFVKRSPEKGLFRIDENQLTSYQITPGGLEILPSLVMKKAVNQLTPQLLEGGKWRECDFRKYDISLNPPRIQLGKKHPYRQFLDKVRTKLMSLGFEEMTGPIVETEFWDMDALFMPQFHSARNIHDVYYIKGPGYARSIPEPFLSQVAECHKSGGSTGSSGWSYEFDKEKTKRLILRSQGTALSARTLARGPKIPGKYFAIARCFRYEQIDATHGTDFFQIEGIVVDPDINFRKLLGLLNLFAREIANARETKFAPGYFPFTEPSVELHAKHPDLGWMELGGAGIFRPEVTIPLNVNVPVLAWGLGIDRMAMVSLGIRDIRQLFSQDLEFIRQSKVVY